MYNLLSEVHKIDTKSEQFLTYIKKHNSFFENFKHYAEYLSEKRGDVRKKSNKAGSYRIALIRRSIAYEKFFKEQLIDFSDMETYKRLKMLDNFEDFKIFNREKKYFYSAALTAYLAYLTFLKEKTDDEYSLSEKEILLKEENPEYIIEKKKKILNSFSRSIEVIKNAKIGDKYTCQYNKFHKTFLTPQNIQYMEAHHIVPLSAQKLFSTNLDVLENVICLCPQCHAEIHYSNYDDRKKLVDFIYQNKIEQLQTAEIKLERKELYRMYQIILSSI